MRLAILLAILLVSMTLAGCSDKASDAPEGDDGMPGQADPSDAAGQGGPADAEQQPETNSEGAMTMRGPGGHTGASGGAGSGAGSGSGSGSGSGGGTGSGGSGGAGGSGGSGGQTTAPATNTSEPEPEPEEPEGPSWDPYNLEGWTTTYGAEGQLAGYSYTATISNDTVRTYQVDARIRAAEDTVLRSVALTADQVSAYLAAGGTATDPASGQAMLASGDVLEASAKVIPVDHVIREMKDGAVVGESVVTAWFPLDGEMPEGYWAVAAMYFHDGTHEGSWEYALGEQPPEGGVAVPYMAGDSLEDYAAFDVLLTIYGAQLYAAYPAEGQDLPMLETQLDARGYLLGDGNASEPGTIMVKPQGITFVLDNATGGALPFQSFQVEQHETVDGQEQSVRLILGIGNPLPQEVGIEVHHPQTGSWRIVVELESLLGTGGVVPPLPAAPGLPPLAAPQL